jgi:hypothetical protein
LFDDLLGAKKCGCYTGQAVDEAVAVSDGAATVVAEVD